VVFTSQSLGVCTTGGINGATVIGVSTGTCTIAADQAGNSGYNAAPQATLSFTVTQGTATLNVTLAGSGGGSVNSNPGGIACTSGSSSGCSHSFSSATPVTLNATPDWKSTFTGWGGPCSGNGSCVISLDGDAGVSATFDTKKMVMLPGPTYFATMQDAYNAASGGDVKFRDQTFSEDLVFNRPISLVLDCGMNDVWSNVGYTYLSGSLTIANGTVTISNLVIQ
jgi:hypothetical protein